MNWYENGLDTFGAIREADIDLVIVEELRCSRDFRNWFLRDALAKFGIDELPESGCVRHRVHRTGESSGESDIEITFSGQSKSGCDVYVVLVEDKIDAPFSNRTKSGISQTERYKIEACRLVETGKCAAAAILLLAPRDYLAAADVSMYATVEMEAVAMWFQNRAATEIDEAQERYLHKAQLLTAGVERHRRGWNRSPDQTVIKLWDLYHHVVRSEFPDLKMNYKEGHPSDSYTVSFSCLDRLPGLPKCRIDHVMERGTIDVWIPGFGPRVQRVAERTSKVRPEDMKFRVSKAGSLGIGFRIESLRRFGKTASEQESLVRSSLNRVRDLKKWFELHAALLATL